MEIQKEKIKRDDLRSGIVASLIHSIICGMSEGNNKPLDAYKIMGYQTPERKAVKGESELRQRIAEAHSRRNESRKK